jgi:hypothetical protein
MAFNYIAADYASMTVVDSTISRTRFPFLTNQNKQAKYVGENESFNISDLSNFHLFYNSNASGSDNFCTSTALAIIEELGLKKDGDAVILCMYIDNAQTDGEWKVRFNGAGVSSISENPFYSKNTKMMRFIRTDASNVLVLFDSN